MNVTISVFGRFHAFYLARQLEQRGHLHCLITSYPKSVVARWGVSKGRVRSVWPVEVARRLVLRLPRRVFQRVDLSDRFSRTFERLAAARVPACTEILVAWSNTAEAAIQPARQMGAAVIVERGSTHIRTQREILSEEFERHGVQAALPSLEVVAKEEREYAAADYLAVPSRFVERTFLDRGFPPRRIFRIPYGVDPGEFAPVEKEDAVFRAVFTGQLAHRKGVQYLLQAWKELNFPEAELLLLGPVHAEFMPWMTKYAGIYRHPGSVKQSQLYRWYSQGSVFVLPSIEEGMALVQLQAMACALPLICTPNSGGSDLIREGEEGYVVPIRDVEALKDRLLWCYEHREACREMGYAARQRILTDFTWDNYGDRVVSAYESIRSKSQ